jgi:hypothetical protein
MKPTPIIWIAPNFVILLGLLSCATSTDKPATQSSTRKLAASETAQVPSWSPLDLDFFLHGSMSTEMIPEAVLRAFVSNYPDLFTSPNLNRFGLIPDPVFGWPVGFSRGPVPHLGGLPAVGVNCAACHVGEVTSSPGGRPLRATTGIQ